MPEPGAPRHGSEPRGGSDKTAVRLTRSGPCFQATRQADATLRVSPHRKVGQNRPMRHETSTERLLRNAARVVIIATALLGGPIACYLAFVAGGAWAYNTIGPDAGDVAAILLLAAAVVAVVGGAAWLWRRVG